MLTVADLGPIVAALNATKTDAEAEIAEEAQEIIDSLDQNARKTALDQALASLQDTQRPLRARRRALRVIRQTLVSLRVM